MVGRMEKYTVCGMSRKAKRYRELRRIADNDDTNPTENGSGVNLQIE